jgi:hypothetical protein
MKKTTGDLANLLTRPFSEQENSRPTFKNFNIQNNQTKKGKGFTILGSVLATAAVVAATTFLILQNSNIDHLADNVLLRVGAGPTNNPYNTTSYNLNSHGT